MKHKLPFVIGISSLLLYKLLYYFTGNIYLALSVFIVPISMLVLNIFLRKKLRYKSWFLSKYNSFLEKEVSTFESDIPKELLFQKVLEVSVLSSFNELDSNVETSELLIGTTPNFWTWGENMYIEIKEKDSETSVVKITSVTIYGSYSWNRNRANYQHFYKSFQQSLTI